VEAVLLSRTSDPGIELTPPEATTLVNALRLLAAAQPGEDRPLERQAAYHICQARAYTQRRDDAEATLALLKLAEISPEDIRYDANASHCIQHLIRRDNYLIRTEVARLAKLAGIPY